MSCLIRLGWKEILSAALSSAAAAVSSTSTQNTSNAFLPPPSLRYGIQMGNGLKDPRKNPDRPLQVAISGIDLKSAVFEASDVCARQKAAVPWLLYLLSSLDRLSGLEGDRILASN